MEVHEVSEGVILSGRAPGCSPEQPSGHFTTRANKINKLLNTFFDMILL